MDTTSGAGPATIVCLHAHPDDEAMLTGELLAKAAACGLRTVVIYGTRGDAGDTEADLGGETLGQRRSREAEAACAELGVARVHWLDWADSGMAGTPANDHPDAFCRAAPAEVAERAAGLLVGEHPLAVVGYDANGTYGHPDHIQVHRSAHALARRLAVPWLLDATYNRDHLATLPGSDGTIDPGFAAAEADLTHFVQGEAWFRAKMEAVKCHTSQRRQPTAARPRRSIDMWRARFGTEWFIARPLGADTSGGLGPLSQVLELKASWPGPLVRPGGCDG